MRGGLGPILAALLLSAAPASAQGVIVTFAGTDRIFPASVPALSAPIDKPDCATTDAAGNVYICDFGNHIVVKIALDGTATVMAGNGIRAGGYSGDGGPATSASFNRPIGVVVDATGNLYIADFNNGRIRKVSPQGIITTVAGNGKCCYSGDGGPATAAALNRPSSVALDGAGNLYFSDFSGNRVRKVTPQGIITTVAGNGQNGFSGDGGPATSAMLGGPSDMTLDAAGNLYIAEHSQHGIRKVTPGGIISTVAGNHVQGFSGDGGQATSASIANPEGIAVDGGGNLFIADGNNRIRKVTPGGIINTVAGGGGSLGDGGPATSAQVTTPMDVAVDAAGNLFIPDLGNRRLRRVSAGGIITTIAGNGQPRFSGDGGPATLAELEEPRQMALDAAGNLFIAEWSNLRVRKISPQGIITTVAGNGQRGSSGDGGPATAASLATPASVALDALGNLYISEFGGGRVRKVNPLGTITLFAGGGGSLGDNGPATSGRLGSPSGVAVDAAGNVFISDNGDHRVRKVSPAGTITTVAGNGQGSSSGDGGQATAASINGPSGVAVDPAGNIYITECSGNRIRKVSQGIITTLVGDGLGCPEGPAVDASGNFYFAANNSIRKINPQGIITTVAGIGRAGFSGDGGLATAALLNGPWGVAVDSAGNLYIGDHFNNRVRKVLSVQPTFAASPITLSFSAPAGSARGTPQQLKLSGNIEGLIWEIAGLPVTGGVSWLTVLPNTGTMPATLSVYADATNLGAGAYQGSVILSATTAQITVPVTFTVSAAQPPGLILDPLRLSFQALVGGAAPPAQSLRIGNSGSGTLSWTASAAGGNWLTISPAAGNTSPAVPANLKVSVNPGGLAAGSYSGSITVQSATTNETKMVAVSVLVQGSGGVLLLSQRSLLFRALQSGGAEPPQTFGVLNTGSGALDWTVTVQSTASWLQVSPGSGRSDVGAAQVPVVTVSVDATSLTAGFYAGQIRVAAAGANNSPQVLRVDLHVLASGTRLRAVVRPTGLIFVAGGSASAGAQEVSVATTEASPVEFVNQAIDGPWVIRAPDLSTTVRGSPGRIVVQPDPGTLAPGVYRAGLTVFTRNDGEQHPVSLLLVVLPPTTGTSAPFSSRGEAADCAPSQLLLQFTSLFSNFNATVGWPSAVLVNARDDCGNPAVGGTVTMSFSSGEPPLKLTDLKNGQYQGMWSPNSAVNPLVTVTARGLWNGLQGQTTATAQIGLNPNTQLASLSQGGVVLGAGFEGGPLAPGSIISLFGQKLAVAENSASSLPLPRTLGGVRVLIGDQTAPLFYVGPSQVNAQVPSELGPDRQLQVQVETNGVPSAPEPVQTAGTRPGLFTVGASGQGAILIANTDRLASPSSPAQVGGFISIYCTGLGATQPAVASGERAPTAPLATVITPVTVTVGGQAAQVLFAGLAPGFVGVYQVNVLVPAGVTLGDAVPVVLTQGGFRSNTATIAVR